MIFASMPAVRSSIFLLLAAALLAGCSATVPIRALPPGEHAITVSVGGPTIELGNSNIPVPYLSAGYFYAEDADLTVGANLHLIPAALGDIIVDATGIYRLHKQSAIPEITATLQVGLMTDLRKMSNGRLIPTIGINASQEIGSRWICFLGFENTLQSSSPDYIVSPLLGARYKFSDGFAMTLEGKWMAANINTAHGILEGAGSVSGHGDLALFLGLEFGL